MLVSFIPASKILSKLVKPCDPDTLFGYEIEVQFRKIGRSDHPIVLQTTGIMQCRHSDAYLLSSLSPSLLRIKTPQFIADMWPRPTMLWVLSHIT